ncbi:hypothetical protein MHU86_13951 [Fragilaria crotonensis]|nr:hypothetical protein MHU86_13951 [Fragilaria crotonensis]
MTVKLSFSDLVDLQSRLVLLPRIEEEGLGAVVASYIPRAGTTNLAGSQFLEEKKVDDKGEENDTQIHEKDSSDCIQSKIETGEAVLTSSDNQQCQAAEGHTLDKAQADEGEQEDAHIQSRDTYSGNDVDPKDIVGKALTGIDGVENEQDWLLEEFSRILASTREVKVPIVLHFDTVPLVEEKETVNQVKEGHIEKPRQRDEARVNTSSWTSWGKSVAATAASSAKGYASATAVAVAKAAEEAIAARQAAEEARAARQARPTIVDLPPMQNRRCCMCLQLSDGSFVELAGSPQKIPKVTTTSVVVLRESPSKPCPAQGYRYEWFRSITIPKCDDTAFDSSSTSSDESMQAGNHQWTPLNGASNSVYQPCANDIGCHLRCVVHVDLGGEQSGTVDDESSVEEEIIICETPFPIAADMNMFNGARQALLRGTYIGNLLGRGPAEGRVFGINISIAFADDKSISSATSIHQISGGTAEPIHQGVIRQASAIADPSNPKHFDLVFPLGLPEGSSMVSALSENDRFQLVAPNRIAREMVLLAIGIANFAGNPADLTETTVLFPALAHAPRTSGTPLKQLIKKNEDLFFTPDQDASIPAINQAGEASARLRSLELELQHLRSKLSRKDKKVADLQRQLALSNSSLHKTEKDVASYRSDLQKKLEESKDYRTRLRVAEKRVEESNTILDRAKAENALVVASLEQRLVAQSEKIVGLEKSVRSYQNEKAVLSAAVEARDSKLEKMNGLQTALDNLSAKVAKGDSLRSEMSDMGKRYEVLCSDLEKVAASEIECKEQLQKTLSTMNELCENLESEKTRRKQCEVELENVQRLNQKLKSERNGFKQKAESLTKEMSRLCKGGLTIQSIEKVLADEESRRTEVDVLRAQKKAALEDLHQYRSAYEQQLVAQLNIGVNGAAIKALEQKAELERVVSDLTEYVGAKEMQLQTMRQVNQALTEELKQLAKASMHKNDI